MDKIYAPWRDVYLQNKQCKTKDECIFCTAFLCDKSEWDNRFILYRNDSICIMLNLYPYAAGHVLIFARDHQEQIYNIPIAVQHQLIESVSSSMLLIQKALQCEGINFGANIGRAAGAGIPQHAHMHIVPRWLGDVNFFPVIGDTKQISLDLMKVYKTLKPLFSTHFLERNA